MNIQLDGRPLTVPDGLTVAVDVARSGDDTTRV